MKSASKIICLFRHSERYPSVKLSNEPYNPGCLTSRAEQLTQIRVEHFKTRFQHVLGHKYDWQSYTSCYPRCENTLLFRTKALGLIPNYADYPYLLQTNKVEEAVSKHQNIFRCYFYHHRHRYEKLLKNTETIKQMEEKCRLLVENHSWLKEYIDFIESVKDTRGMLSSKFYYLSDYVCLSKEQSLPIPSELSQISEQLSSFRHDFEMAESETFELNLLCCFMLIKRFLTCLTEREEKLFLFSGHDTSILNVMGFLGNKVEAADCVYNSEMNLILENDRLRLEMESKNLPILGKENCSVKDLSDFYEQAQREYQITEE